MFNLRAQQFAPQLRRSFIRAQSTLRSNPSIHVFPNPKGPEGTSILTLLDTSPPKPDLALGTTTKVPPTPDSFTENHHFLEVLHSVVEEHATKDPEVIKQAKAFASTGGGNLGSAGAFFPGQKHPRSKWKQYGGGGGAGGGGAGGASAQGGMGGAGVGGWVHVADSRNPPDWGRTNWPEDILGSVNVDGDGNFVGANGSYSRSGTYRILTPDGILGISPYLMKKLVERLREIQSRL